jgi:prepilin-type N-terminal cleavage/methylation domain-containing protein
LKTQRVNIMNPRVGRCNGFTLLEVIVVLMISGLIAAVLMQGLSLMLESRLRVAGAIDGIDRKGIQTSILTSPLRGVLPDYYDGPDVFAGYQKQMRGLTLSPLQGTSGAPTGFGMNLDYDSLKNTTTITYYERGYDPLELAQWLGNLGEFSYRGRNGDWEESWPPRRDDAKQAPRTIRVLTGLQDTAYVIRIMAPHDRVGRRQDGPFGDVQ